MRLFGENGPTVLVDKVDCQMQPPVTAFRPVRRRTRNTCQNNIQKAAGLLPDRLVASANPSSGYCPLERVPSAELFQLAFKQSLFALLLCIRIFGVPDDVGQAQHMVVWGLHDDDPLRPMAGLGASSKTRRRGCRQPTGTAVNAVRHFVVSQPLGPIRLRMLFWDSRWRVGQ